MKSLSNRQREIFEFIKRFCIDYHFPPTIREIGTEFDISAKAAYDHLKSLQKKGFIECGSNQARAIRIIDSLEEAESEMVKIPILGNVSAGLPLLSEENYDGSLSLSRDFAGHDKLFALRVKGDSMNDAGILDGDIAIIRKQSTANNGEIVVVHVDEAITLKRFYKEKNRIRLQAENTNYQPIYLIKAGIVGKLSSIIRNY